MIRKRGNGFSEKDHAPSGKLDHDPTEHGLAAHGEDCPTNNDAFGRVTSPRRAGHARRRCRGVAVALVAGRIRVISASRAVVIVWRGGSADRGRTNGCRANSGSDAPSRPPTPTRVSSVPHAAP